jgi:hypothetical protein
VLYAAFLGLLLAAGFASAVEVTTAGMAPVIDGKVPAARKAALEESKRAAVEQVLGSYLESRTQTSDFALASDRIYSSVAGRIDRYRVILDEQQGDLYRIEIVATFEDGALLSETERLLKKYHWHKKPRLLIAVTGRGEPASAQSARQLQQLLEKRFRHQGFEVFEESDGIAKRAGFLLEAESWLNASNNEYHGVSLDSSEVSVTATLKRVGSGQIIASTSYTGTKAGANRSKALNALNEEAAKIIYRELNWELSEEWLRHQSRGTDIVLMLSGEDISDRLGDIKAALNRRLRGVRSLTVDSTSRTDAVLSVVYQGWPEQLYDELLAAIQRDASLGLALEGLKGNTLQLRVL